jgi:hypothetical protein
MCVDLYASLTSPVEAVFGHLADPARLADWVHEVAAACAGPQSPADIGVIFSFTARAESGEVAASGEVVAFEPPWLVGYRLFIGKETFSLRVTCSAQPGGSRLHIHQPDSAAPLTVDLARLNRALIG